MTQFELDSYSAQITLSGAIDSLWSAGYATMEQHVITFHNYSAGTPTLTVWANGTDNGHLIAPPAIPLLPGETFVLRIRIGAGDTLNAQSSDADAIAVADELDGLFVT